MSDTQPGAPGIAAATTAPKPVSNTYRLYVMVMLFLVYAFNFLDRQIISILAIPIREELGLDDRQLGLLGGIAFALLYSTLGVPIAWLADRTNRVWIITISLTVWSGFTALCGLAQNFWQLFAARVGVGVGEAGGGRPVLLPHRGLFPAPSAGARARLLFAGHSAGQRVWRHRGRTDRQRQCGRGAGLALGLHHRGPCRRAACPDLPPDRARTGARPA